MEFTIQTSELARGLHRAQGIVEKKTALPILSNVLVEASKGKVSITATGKAHHRRLQGLNRPSFLCFTVWGMSV